MFSPPALLACFACCILLEPASAGMVEDVTLKYSESIDIANKMLYDIDNNIEIHLGDRPGAYHSVLPPLMSKNAEGSTLNSSIPAAVAPSPPNSLQELIDNLGELDRKLQVTHQALQQRRRFVLGAMIHQMQGTVRRIRQNVVRIQVQFTAIESVGTQAPVLRLRGTNATNDDAAAMAAANANINKEYVHLIQQQVYEVSSKINDIVTRLSVGLKVSSEATPVRTPLNPIVTLNSIIQGAGHTFNKPKN